jgi:hypothetical protein
MRDGDECMRTFVVLFSLDARRLDVSHDKSYRVIRYHMIVMSRVTATLCVELPQSCLALSAGE